MCITPVKHTISNSYSIFSGLLVLVFKPCAVHFWTIHLSDILRFFCAIWWIFSVTFTFIFVLTPSWFNGIIFQEIPFLWRMSYGYIQFAFFDDNSEYLPRTYPNPNCVVYPGSHDADCVKTRCKNLTGPARVRFNRECPHRPGQSRT